MDQQYLLKKTKIVATLGPASWEADKIEALLAKGVNLFRLNFSHGSPEEHGKLIGKIRRIAKKCDLPVGILADLPGPKLRVGTFNEGNPIFLKIGERITLSVDDKIEDGEIPIEFKGLVAAVSKGDHLLLADGKIELVVERKTSTKKLSCRVVVGGELKQRQGLNIPGKRLDIPALTFRDKKAFDLISKINVDYIALSFVQTEDDINKARQEMTKRGMDIPLIAKIEKPEAVRRIDSIIQLVDGIMIARGDLGVELPPEEIPVIQKRIISLCSRNLVPVITATQMLESMTYNSRPTRAEATDVANAIWDGTDAVMLSGETASGAYPIESVEMMSKIINKAEAAYEFSKLELVFTEKSDQYPVLFSVSKLAKPSIYKAIITFTETGATARALSKMKPQVPIFAITHSTQAQNRMSLFWGTRAFVCKRGRSVDELIRNAEKILLENTTLKKGDKVVLTAGTQLTSGATNMMKIHQVGGI